MVTAYLLLLSLSVIFYLCNYFLNSSLATSLHVQRHKSQKCSLSCNGLFQMSSCILSILRPRICQDIVLSMQRSWQGYLWSQILLKLTSVQLNFTTSLHWRVWLIDWNFSLCMGAKNQYSIDYNLKTSSKIASCNHNLQMASNRFSQIITKQNECYHYITLYLCHFWIDPFFPQWKMLSIEVSLWGVWELTYWGFFNIYKPHRALPALTTSLQNFWKC